VERSAVEGGVQILSPVEHAHHVDPISSGKVESQVVREPLHAHYSNTGKPRIPRSVLGTEKRMACQQGECLVDGIEESIRRKNTVSTDVDGRVNDIFPCP